jgi:NTP-dependent ternary system trypsin peptidase co-occuring protein
MNPPTDSNLSELIRYIRAELEKADRVRLTENQKALFELSGMELELNFAVVRDATAKGGFDLKVISAGGETTLRNEQIQKVRLTYKVASDAKKFNLAGMLAELPNKSPFPSPEA